MLRNKSDFHGVSKNIQKPLTLHHANFQNTSSSSNLNINNCNQINNNTGNNISSSGSPLEALPKPFVISMKKLFDILDDRHCGFVKFSDIEKGWQDDGCKGLPRGVIESLRKVTPASGLLSFERFCAGLKICLLRNQAPDSERPCLVKAKLPFKSARSPSAPLLQIENPLANTMPWNTASHSTTAAVRSQNIAESKRALSLPQLSPDSDVGMEMEFKMNSGGKMNGLTTFSSPPPPPKPPRSGGVPKTSSNMDGRSNKATATDKLEIRHALQNWQMSVLLNEMDNTNDKMTWKQFPHFRGCADGGSSSTNDSGGPLYAKKSSSGSSSSKRREPRRHTLQSGIDYNVLKRLKQYEEERSVLLLGLNAVEKARDWYMQQLAAVQEKLRYLGRMGDTQVQWSEVQQEHLNFQRARVLEVNRNLATLAETWERAGFPMHFNLALSSAPRNTTRRNTSGGGSLDPVDLLRQKNRHLVDEGNLESDRIALLEGEKQTLLRELFLLQQRTPVGRRGVEDGLMGVLGQASPVCSSSSGGLGDVDVVY